jgi:hypothetical protein
MLFLLLLMRSGGRGEEGKKIPLLPLPPLLARDFVGQDLLLVPGTAAVVRNAQGDVLLQRRSDNGQWGLLGGAVDPHESPHRRLYEKSTKKRDSWFVLCAAPRLFGWIPFIPTVTTCNLLSPSLTVKLFLAS